MCVPPLSTLVIKSMILSWALSSYRQCDQSAITVLLVAHCSPIFLFSSSLLPSGSIHRAKCSTSLTVPRVPLSFAPVSSNITNSENCLFLAVLHTRRRLDSRSLPSLCNGVCDPWPAQYNTANLKCRCSSEAGTVFVQTSAHFSLSEHS